MQFLEAVDGRGCSPYGEVLRAAPGFRDLEMGAIAATGEHPLLWKEHHLAYIQLVEECLGVERFLEQARTSALCFALEVVLRIRCEDSSLL